MGDSAGSRERVRRAAILALCAAAAGLILAAGLRIRYLLDSRSRSPSLAEGAAAVPSASPAPSSATPSPSDGRVLLGVPMFKQWDPAWGGDALGGSGEQLRCVGCTVSCVAMVFRHYGIEADPGRLNAWLKGNGGYTARGWLKWDKCVEYSGGRAALEYIGEPDAARMGRAFEAGRPAIVKVLLDGGVQHWVLVVGREGSDWLVNDPLNLSFEPVRLSDYRSGALALRIFRKAG